VPGRFKDHVSTPKENDYHRSESAASRLPA
jgi:hypothetical protein